VLTPTQRCDQRGNVEREMGGRELAQTLNDLDEKELQSFVGELVRHPELLEEISDRVDLVLGENEASRDYGDFARELSREGLL